MCPGARVYLHAGVRDGANALGLDPARRAVEMGELPEEVRRLQPHEVEDFLCIYKAQLAGKPGPSRPCRRPPIPEDKGETPCIW